jgi:UDP-glucose 4-epimerase
MKNALVTGGNGFVGGAVVRALRAAGYVVEVAGTSTLTDPLDEARIRALASFDVLVHCAGSSSVGASVADPHGDFAKTVPPFARLLESVRTRSAHARVVLLSSAAVYGDAAELPTSERCAVAPVSPYGFHKRICEELCLSYGRNYGIASVILRFFSVYGPGLRKQLFWDACRKARAGDTLFAGTGDEQRDWLHVDDAAQLVVASLASAAADAPVINGASGVGVRVRDAIGQIYRELAAGPAQFSGAARPGDPSRYVADIERARSLGWAPSIDLERGIAEYVAWFREQE